jgi:alkanesulfonate monooxygenase SsuD/methylene tetrahydromethanopterin reductase-like flavin-dependent oxidoreductase (luciferase family)
MKFGLLQEAESEMRSTHHIRYKEVVKEVQYAEEMDFDYWGTSEQHFVSPLACVTAPEVFYGYVAARTSRIKLRHMVTLMPFAFNHPIRVAERIATLDILSDGRAELGMGRANHLWQLDAFGIKSTETRAQMLEAMEIVDNALSCDEFEHHGPLLQIPRRRLSPRPYQHPRPPFFVIATSVESHTIAGERGYGVISCDNWRGWDHLAEQVAAYRAALRRAKPPVPSNAVSSVMGHCALTGFCASSYEKAKEIAGPVAYGFFNDVLEYLYLPLARSSADYGYFKKIAEDLADIRERRDLDGLIDRSPTILLGTPDQLIEKIRRLEKMGYEEVVLRIDAVGHENVMESLRLMGRYVIPEFKRPTSVIRELSIPGRVA